MIMIGSIWMTAMRIIESFEREWTFGLIYVFYLKSKEEVGF